MEKEYFDAKFDGLKELLASQQTNTTAHILAVGQNVKEVRADLQAHKDSTDAHGRKAGERATAEIVSWLGIFAAVSVGFIDFLKRK